VGGEHIRDRPKDLRIVIRGRLQDQRQCFIDPILVEDISQHGVVATGVSRSVPFQSPSQGGNALGAIATNPVAQDVSLHSTRQPALVFIEDRLDVGQQVLARISLDERHDCFAIVEAIECAGQSFAEDGIEFRNFPIGQCLQRKQPGLHEGPSGPRQIDGP
jgi:hypothetical protein